MTHLAQVCAFATLFISFVAGDNNCQAVLCPDPLPGANPSENENDEALLLLQRRARSFHVSSNSSDQSEPGLIKPQSLALSLLSQGVVWDASQHAASWVIGFWVTFFGLALSSMMSSALSSVERRKGGSADRQDVMAKECDERKPDDIVATALSVNAFRCLTFAWMDPFLSKAPGVAALRGLDLVSKVTTERVDSLWATLRRAVSNPVALMLCAWFVAFLELVAMVLILDALLLMYEHRGYIWNGPHGALQLVTAVILLLFIIPMLYRYFSALLLMLDGLHVAQSTSEVSSMLYQKALRLPIGANYHGHKADEELSGWQVAKTLVDGIAQEWPLMFRTLALFTAAPIMAGALCFLLVLHLRFWGLVGLPLLLPGALLAGILVKYAVGQRQNYQYWQNERLRCQHLLATPNTHDTLHLLGAIDVIEEKVMAARRNELRCNQHYSVIMALMAGNLHASVWLVVVASLYMATLHGSVSPRNLWLMLQMVTSLQACHALIFSGLRRALALPGSLQRIDCFLKQPEMPCDVVKMPLSTSPTVKISGSFSFEEGGPMVLRDLDLSIHGGETILLLGDHGSGKSSLILAFLGELFPCGLACVSSTPKRRYIKGSAKMILQDETKLSELDLLLWDDVEVEDLPRLHAATQRSGTALVVATRTMPEVRPDSCRVVRLQQGRLMQVDSNPDSPRERTALKILGDALRVADFQRIQGLLAEKWQGEMETSKESESLWRLAFAFLGATGRWTVTLVLLLVLVQRSLQLLQFLFLATWADAVEQQSSINHKTFAVSIVITVVFNTAMLTLSEWCGSRLAFSGYHLISRRLGDDVAEVDSVLISSWLACARSVIGSLLQQSYILLIAPLWLAVTVLLPAYLCIAFFASIYLRSAVHFALQGEECFREAQEILQESLDPDPVLVRANHLQQSFEQRFSLQMRLVTGFTSMLPAACKSWLSFRVTFCIAFAATCCALQVLLSNHDLGVGTFGLVISLLFSLTTDVELACDSCVQGCRALGALRRLGAFLREEPLDRSAAEPMEVEEDSCSVSNDHLLSVGRGCFNGLEPGRHVAVVLPDRTVKDELFLPHMLLTKDPCVWNGSWRENLDPAARCSDDDLWRILKGVQLAEQVEALDSRVPSLPLFQRQLLGAARCATFKTGSKPPTLVTEVLDPLAMQVLFSEMTSTIVVVVDSEAEAQGLSLEVVTWSS